MALDQATIDAYNAAKQAVNANSGWFPSDKAMLKNLIDALQFLLITEPQVMAHGGSDAEEIRFRKEVQKEELDTLRRDYRRLDAKSGNGNGGFRQNQLSRNARRWPA